MFSLHKESKVSPEEQCKITVEVKAEHAAYHFVNVKEERCNDAEYAEHLPHQGTDGEKNVEHGAGTDIKNGSLSSTQITEGTTLENSVKIKEEPCDSYAGQPRAPQSGELALKSEDVGVGCDYIEHSPGSISHMEDDDKSDDNTDINPQTYKMPERKYLEESYPSILKRALTRGGEPTYNCTICVKKFSRKSNLKRHMSTHASEKPYTCEVCEKGFPTKLHLNSHSSTHIGLKPHKCDICEKQFTVKNSLNKHMLIHSGEKPHKCLICEAAFSQKITLQNHMLTHTGEKPHKCPVCETKFTVRSTLNVHLLTHTGEKPHKCGICGKHFRLVMHLNRHTLTHTGEKPHKCSDCATLFAHKFSLKKHMLFHCSKKWQ